MKTPMRWAALVLTLLLTAPSVFAAGTVTATSTAAASSNGHVMRYTYHWTSDASGNVSGDTSTVVLRDGHIIKMEYVPDGGGSQPSDLYDLTLLDANSVDLLNGIGANLSNATSTIILAPDLWVDRAEHLQIVVANAGNAKGGTVSIWVSQP